MNDPYETNLPSHTSIPYIVRSTFGQCIEMYENICVVIGSQCIN